MKVYGATRALLLAAATLSLAAPFLSADSRQNDRPLTADEIHALVERVISNQHKNDAALADFERRERRQARKEEEDTRLSEDKTFRVVPTGTGTLRLLVEEDGQPVSAELYRKQLRDLEQALLWALNPAESRQKRRVEKWDKRVRERAEMVDAVGNAFRFTWQGREDANGRALVKLLLEPEPSFKPRSRTTEMFRHVRATLWIDEAAAQLVRAEAEIITDISIGGGVLGKIYRGGRFVMEQVQVAEGIWLTSRYQYDFEGRRFLFGFQVHEVTLANAYRRIGSPKEALAAVRHELNNSPAPSNSH